VTPSTGASEAGLGLQVRAFRRHLNGVLAITQHTHQLCKLMLKLPHLVTNPQAANAL